MPVLIEVYNAEVATTASGKYQQIRMYYGRLFAFITYPTITSPRGVRILAVMTYPILPF